MIALAPFLTMSPLRRPSFRRRRRACAATRRRSTSSRPTLTLTLPVRRKPTTLPPVQRPFDQDLPRAGAVLRCPERGRAVSDDTGRTGGGMWGLVAGLVAFAYGAPSHRHPGGRSAAPCDYYSFGTHPSSSTRYDGAAGGGGGGLRRQVAELRATRGLSGPEVRALVETLLPAPGCVAPPCEPPTARLSLPPLPRRRRSIARSRFAVHLAVGA